MSTLLQQKCPNCGGSVSFDTGAQKLKCPFCDSEFDVEAAAGQQTEDGGAWLVAFTDEEEMQKGQETGIVSNFIDTFFDMVFSISYVEGFILNPWGVIVILLLQNL